MPRRPEWLDWELEISEHALEPQLSEAGVRVGASVADLDDELRRGARPG
jgi:hypothetical protein